MVALIALACSAKNKCDKHFTKNGCCSCVSLAHKSWPKTWSQKRHKRWLPLKKFRLQANDKFLRWISLAKRQFVECYCNFYIGFSFNRGCDKRRNNMVSNALGRYIHAGASRAYSLVQWNFHRTYTSQRTRITTHK